MITYIWESIKMRIYLDNCCLNRPFDDQDIIRIKLETEAVMYIQSKIIDKTIELAWSYIIDYENQANPFDERRDAIVRWKSYAIVDSEEDKGVLKKAGLIRKLGVKAKDALHAACAVQAGCDYFLSTDDFLLKKLEKLDGIKASNPIAFLSALEEMK
jgi:predicted nucleic acid-binding protein